MSNFNHEIDAPLVDSNLNSIGPQVSRTPVASENSSFTSELSKLRMVFAAAFTEWLIVSAGGI